MLDRIASLLRIKRPSTDPGYLIASGDTVPGAVSGYQTGCIFQKTNGGAGTSLYVNEGSYASASFQAVSALTAAQEALLAATPGTATASKALIADANVGIAGLGITTATVTVTSATPATTRLVQSELVVTPATDVAVASNGSLCAVRGAVTLTSGKSISDGYLFGAQGKVVVDGATVNVGSDHIAGVYGQLSAASSTLTAGHIAAVMGSIQGVPTSSIVDLFYGESATGNVINSFFKAFGKADYVFDFETNTHTQIATPAGSTPSGNLRVLKVKLDGADYYILAAAAYGA